MEAKLKANFKNFLFYIWKHLGLPPPTDIQYDIGEYLQHGPKRLIIQAGRGEGKSWITSAFVLWLLYCDPQVKILVVSASKQRADDFSTFTKRLIHEVPLLQHLKARNTQRDSNIAFDVGPAKPAHAPSVKSVGVTGQMTGSRANVIIADDVEVPNNSATQIMREKLGETVKEFDAVLSPNGRIIYLGTPQSEMTLYSELESRGYVARLWPAIYPNKHTLEEVYKHPDRLSPYLLERLNKGLSKPGDAVDPKRFTLLDLAERKASYGNTGFALQFLLDTTLSDRLKYPLTLRDLIVTELDDKLGPASIIWTNSPSKRRDDLPSPGLSGDYFYGPLMLTEDRKEWQPYEVIALAIDPSGRGKDETGYAVVGYLYGRLFLLDAGGFIGGYNDGTLNKLGKIAQRWNVNQVLIESTWGDGMFTKLFTPILHKHHKVTIEESKSNKQKELRIIETLEPLINQHRLIVNSELVLKDTKTDMESVKDDRQYQLFYQLTRLTAERGSLAHEDRLDALEIACRYFLEIMDKDVEQAAATAKADQIEQSMRGYISNMYGVPFPDNPDLSIFE